MTNAFNWQGKPSIFTSNSPQQPFGAAREASRHATSMRKKAAPTQLPGGSPYDEPELVTKGKPRSATAKKEPK